MSDRRTIAVAGGTVHVVFTGADDGDFRILDPVPDLDRRRRAVVDRSWNWIRQVHGNRILEVSEPGQVAGSEADGLVTTAADCPIAVTTADCAPVVLVADRGLAVLHVGWRGLVAGIVERGGRRLTELAGDPVAAVLGPCIHPAHYEFGEQDLQLVVDGYGPTVVGTTARGTQALDMPAAVALACTAAGWPPPEAGPCTSDEQYFSHRVRADRARLATVAWLDGSTDTGRRVQAAAPGVRS